MQSFNYVKAASLAEASEMLLSGGQETHLLNGGTDLIVRMREGITKPKDVVDIKAIEGLKGFCEKDGYFVFGACNTMNEITSNEVVCEKFRILAEGCHSVGSYSVRNRATVAGNLCNASPLADSATPLLVLEASLSVFTKNGEKEIPLTEFFLGVRKTKLEPGDIVTAIKVPMPKQPVTGAFFKQSRRSEVDLSTVCATVANVDGEIRVAYGSVAPTPLRARKTEEFLKNENLLGQSDSAKIDEIVQKAMDIVTEEVAPISDIRASKEYRTEICRVLLKRGLRKILGQEE